MGCCARKAVTKTDGSYKITGTKIFISAGEHDLSTTSCIWCWRASNAPAGTKGISLFIVPKFCPRTTARWAANGVMLRHRRKMGIHGNATCVMNYDGATGCLVGEENGGIDAMFTMMNEARLGVGMQGLGLPRPRIRRRDLCEGRLQGRAIRGGKSR